jgi:peptide/nickel transport system permease protein
MLIALPVGIYSALGKSAIVTYALRLFSIAGLSIPTFWLSIIVLYILIRYFNWSPQFRYISFLDDPVANFKMFVIPAGVFAYANAAVIARMLRSQLLEIAGEDYIRTARAKGLGATRVNYRHALPNALLPVVTIIGSQFAAMVTGLVIVERIFALPGLGTTMVNATLNSDYILVQSLFMLIAFMVLAVNLVVDVLYGLLDPRIRLS